MLLEPEDLFLQQHLTLLFHQPQGCISVSASGEWSSSLWAGRATNLRDSFFMNHILTRQRSKVLPQKPHLKDVVVALKTEVKGFTRGLVTNLGLFVFSPFLVVAASITAGSII